MHGSRAIHPKFAFGARGRNDRAVVRRRIRWSWLTLAVMSCAPAGSGVQAERSKAPDAVATNTPPGQAGGGQAAKETCDPLTIESFDVEQKKDDPEPVPIADGDRLAPFYETVARLLRGKADKHIKIAVYGDSNLIADYQTGEIRRKLQGRFGDAGHGLVSVGEPWWFYKHFDVVHGSHNWICHNVSTDPVMDRLYGLTGIAAESGASAGSAFVATAGEKSPIGKTADTFEVFYLARKGVTFDVKLDGELHGNVTSADSGDSGMGVYRVDTADAPHRLEIVPKGLVRVLGVALERKHAPPSFIVDSFGVGAMNSRSQATKNAPLETAMLKQRGYDLVIFHSGHNDGFTHRETPAALRSIVAMHRAALPNAPILIMTPGDRGQKDTFYFTKIAVEQRRELAGELETAMWDLWTAMGGRGSMARFKVRGLALSDYAHFNEKGGAWVGDRLLQELWRDLARYVAAHPRAGCE
jgi:hypothetical protein